MVLTVHAQDTLYLDAEGLIVKDKVFAQEYAVLASSNKQKYDSITFYSINNELRRICSYNCFGTKPEDRILHGQSFYKFAGSLQDSLVCYYNKNLRTGGGTFYYPDGNLKVECIFREGVLDGILHEYYPNGNFKRKDIYKKGVCIGSNFFSPEGELLGTSPFYIGPQTDVDYQTLMHQLGEMIEMPHNIWKQAGNWKIYIEALFDENGKLGTVYCLQTNNDALIKPSIKYVTQLLQDYEFTPATMDNQSVASSMIFPLGFRVEAVNNKPNNNTNSK